MMRFKCFFPITKEDIKTLNDGGIPDGEGYYSLKDLFHDHGENHQYIWIAYEDLEFNTEHNVDVLHEN